MNKTKITLLLTACWLTTTALSQTAPDIKLQEACATRGPACASYLKASHLPAFLRGAVGHATSAAAMPQTAQYNFTTLSVPQGVGGAEANGINNSGVVAGYYYDASYNIHGFVWQQGTAQTVDYPGASATFLNGINNHGLVIATIFTDGYHTAIYSISTGAWTVLPDIPNFSLLPFSINGINDDGVATGYSYSFIGNIFGFLAWTCQIKTFQYSFFTEPGAAQAATLASAISGKGDIVGQFMDVPAGGQHGFLKQHDKYTSFDFPAGGSTSPTGINRAATIVGVTYSSVVGFVRTVDGAISTVNYPGSAETDIWGINDQGVLCGDWWDSNYNNQYAVVATPVVSSAGLSKP